MSLLDKVVAAVTPPESDAARHEARTNAQAAAEDGDWLDLVLAHHRQIEGAFLAVKHATDVSSRKRAQLSLATLLTGHANAEECNVKTYNRDLMKLIHHGRANPSMIISHELSLEQAPQAYKHFDDRDEGWTKVILHPKAA